MLNSIRVHLVNRIRAHLMVYGRHIEVVLIIAALLLGGGIGGYMIGRVEMADVITRIQASHVAEVERLQASNRDALAAIAGRLDVVMDRQERAANEVGEAAQVARRAATTAQGAAVNAARSVIRERRE